jgi:hypothetical protein
LQAVSKSAPALQAVSKSAPALQAVSKSAPALQAVSLFLSGYQVERGKRTMDGSLIRLKDRGLTGFITFVRVDMLSLSAEDGCSEHFLFHRGL